MTPRIIFCVESGIYEIYALVLARSIRRFGGSISGAECIAVSPRKNHPPGQKASKALSRLGVEVLNENVNWKYENYPLANKPLSLAAFQALDRPTLWLDSDTIVIRDPALSIDEAQVMACPVFAKGIGSSGPGDLNEPYWSELYKLCGNSKDVYCSTVLGGDRIRAYYNTGVILCQPEVGLFGAWATNLKKVLASNIRPANGSEYMLEQSTFAATVLVLDLKLEVLPVRCNYPIHARNLVQCRHGVKMEDSSIWHHTNRFSNACQRFRAQLDAHDWEIEVVDEFLDNLISNPDGFVNKVPNRLVRAGQKLKHMIFGKR